MSLSTCENCGGRIPLGLEATNRCEKCGTHLMGRIPVEDRAEDGQPKQSDMTEEEYYNYPPPKEKHYRPWTVAEARGQWVVFGDYTVMLSIHNSHGQFLVGFGDEWLTTDKILARCEGIDGELCGVEVAE